MKYLGIDLSLRSTGLVSIKSDGLIEFKLITSNSKKLNNEELLIYNINEICKFIEESKPDYIGLEGLSFGSITGSKDILAGNFWYLRTEIYKRFSIKCLIIPVLTWRSKLFNKDERKIFKENNTKLKLMKEMIKETKPNKIDKKRILEDNKELILKSNIKYLTWEKLPANIRDEFGDIGFTNGGFDLTDAYFIAQHIKDK